MSQLAQAKGLHERGVQLFEEARRGLTDALGVMSEASEKLKSGELTPEARATWKEKFEAAHADATELKKRAKDLADLNTGLDDFEALGETPNYTRPMGAETGEPGGGTQTHTSTETRSETLRTGAVRNDAESWGPESERSRVLLRGRPRTLLNRLMRPEARGGGFRALKDDEVKLLTSPRPETLMSPYIDQDGGLITAEEVRNEVIGHLRDLTYIRSRARVIATTASSVTFPSARIDLKLKKTRAGIGTGEQPKVLKDVFGKTTFVPSGESEIVKVPEELLDDATFDVVGFIAEEIAKNDAESEEQKFLIGNGAGEPLGILTALQKLTAAGFVGLGFDHSGSGAAFSPDDVKKFPYKLRKIFRVGGRTNGAAWTANKAWIEPVAVMRTDSGAGAGTGQYLFRQGIEIGDPDVLVGYPILESEFYPDHVTSGSAGDPLVLFGDWRHYWIVDRKSLAVRLLAELYSESDEIGYKYQKRYDGAPVRAEAFVYMKRKA